MIKTNFKKLFVLALISVFVLVFSISSLSVFKVSAEVLQFPKLTTDSTDVVQGDTFTTTVKFEKNSSVCSASLYFTYDEDKVDYISCVTNEDSLVEPTLNIGDGKIALAFANGRNITAELPLIDITFRVREDIGAGAYDFLTLVEGQSFVRRLDASGIVADVDYEYDCNKLNIYQAGDINLDGKVNGIDAVYILRYEAALASGNETTDFYLPYHESVDDYSEHQKYMLNMADAFFDGQVTARDAVSILRHEAGFENEILGNRVSVDFYDGETLLMRKSVVVDGSLSRIPNVPDKDNYASGKWSSALGKYIEASFATFSKDTKIFAYYGDRFSEAMIYYKNLLTKNYYSGDLKYGLNGTLILASDLTWQDDYTAKVYWSSSNNATLNAQTGEFARTSYDSAVTLSAHIVSYKGSIIESTGDIDFVYNVNGKFTAPTKADVSQWINNFFKDGINYNVKLPQKLTNEDLSSSYPYELRIDWAIKEDGVEKPIGKIERTNYAKNIDLVATVTFNGEPLENDGKIYIDNISVTAIDETEIRAYVIEQISANMGVTATNKEEFWHGDTPYATTIKWISKNSDIATVENNIINVKNETVNGTLLPLVAQVTYPTDEGSKTFELSYTISVVTDNSLLVPGTNIEEDLYYALKEATGVNGNLTTEALKANTFVYLDLSKYPDIHDLTGLSYCRNLRVLNISGLHITRGMNEICTLSYLEAFLAKGCGLDNLTDGGVAVLKNAINLKLIDLSHNNFTSLDSVFAEGVKYGKLSEVYLNDNNIQDISTLSRAPAMSILALSNNGLTSEKIAPIANFKYLIYLSLSDNEITDISALKDLTYLKELRLHNNHITEVRNLKKLTNLEALYLGDNDIVANIDFLDYLTNLKVLYLNNNRIDDISGLRSLNKLESINVSGNNIDSLMILENYSSTLEEIYAENNVIASLSFARNMTKLRILMLSNNVSEAERSLTSYLSGLTNLEVLTLSGKPISDLSFVDNMGNLVCLDISNCSMPAYLVTNSLILTNNETGARTLEISEYQDNIASILKLKGNLKYLDISDNNMAYYTDEVLDYMSEYQNINPNVSGLSFTGALPSTIGDLYELNKLMVLYMNNINKIVDAVKLTPLMTDLRYIAMENCGITSMSWLSRFRNLVFVDLADNYIKDVKLGTYISNRSRQSLKYLYLDTNAQDAVLQNAYNDFDENVLVELSLAGIKINHMGYLPYMDNLKYLNIANTGLESIQGTDPDFYDTQSILRYSNLKTLNISHLNCDISCLTSLANLKTLYAVSDVSEKIFYKTGLDTLYALYNSGVTCYLYDENTAYKPVSTTEGGQILSRIDDISCDITVAADNVISDNNPFIIDEINDYTINWSLSNPTNYEIVDNHLSIKSYDNLVDETLNITAEISVYPGQINAVREFTINTHILRASAKYYEFDTTGLYDYMSREGEFTYSVALKSAETEGFTEAVKPVENDIRYNFVSRLENGQITPNVMAAVSENEYRIDADAPLNSVTDITVSIGHNVNGVFVVDDTLNRSFTVKGRVFTATYVLNGGRILATDGSEITSQQMPEDTAMFENVTVERTGYLFDGWFTDSEFTNVFAVNSEDAVMPASDITLYAKWTPHSFNLTFDPNEGTVSETSRMVLCDQQFGELPAATRDYYTFAGWFTQAEGGDEITATTVSSTADDITVYAHWTENELSDWIEFGNMPDDGQIVEEKWTYSETTTLESTDTSLDGYTQVSSRWVESGHGSSNYANFNVNSPLQYNTGDWYYQNYMKGPYSAHEDATSKRVVSNTSDGYIFWQWYYKYDGYGKYIGADPSYSRPLGWYYGDTANGCPFHYWASFKSYNAGEDAHYSSDVRSYYYDTYSFNKTDGGNRWFWRINAYVSSYTDYYKVFTYSKTESKESSTIIVASDSITNVKHMVKYRAK